MQKKLEEKEKQLEDKREKLLEDVEEEKQRIIDKAKKEVNEIIALLSKGDLKLHEVIELKARLDELEESDDEIVIYNEEINQGDYVSIPSLNLSGVVKRLKDGKATISSDSGMTLTVSGPSATATSRANSNWFSGVRGRSAARSTKSSSCGKTRTPETACVS